MSKPRTVALAFAAIGLAIPLVVLALKSIAADGFSPAWILYVWPSYFILGGLSGPIDLVTIAYIIISIMINVALYAYVGSAFGRLTQSYVPSGSSPEDDV